MKRYDYITTMLWLILLVALLPSSCIMDDPRMITVGDKTYIKHRKRVAGIPYSDSIEEVKTPEQKAADLENKKDEAAVNLDINTKRQQSTFATWLGGGLIALAVIFAIVGGITKGWAYWGLLAALSASCGATAWGCAQLVRYMKWAPITLVILGILKGMHAWKDFSLKKKIEDRKLRKWPDTSIW